MVVVFGSRLNGQIITASVGPTTAGAEGEMKLKCALLKLEKTFSSG